MSLKRVRELNELDEQVNQCKVEKYELKEIAECERQLFQHEYALDQIVKFNSFGNREMIFPTRILPPMTRKCRINEIFSRLEFTQTHLKGAHTYECSVLNILSLRPDLVYFVGNQGIYIKYKLCVQKVGTFKLALSLLTRDLDGILEDKTMRIGLTRFTRINPDPVTYTFENDCELCPFYIHDLTENRKKRKACVASITVSDEFGILCTVESHPFYVMCRKDHLPKCLMINKKDSLNQ